jgi:hypothetical protein
MLNYERNNEISNIIDNSLILIWYKLNTNPYIQRYKTLILKREIKTRYLKEHKVWKTIHLQVYQTSRWDRLLNIRIRKLNKLDLTQRENLASREEDCQSWSIYWVFWKPIWGTLFPGLQFNIWCMKYEASLDGENCPNYEEYLGDIS